MNSMDRVYRTHAPYSISTDDGDIKDKLKVPSPRAQGSGFMEKVKTFFTWTIEALASAVARIFGRSRSENNTSSQDKASSTGGAQLNLLPCNTLEGGESAHTSAFAENGEASTRALHEVLVAETIATPASVVTEDKAVVMSNCGSDEVLVVENIETPVQVFAEDKAVVIPNRESHKVVSVEKIEMPIKITDFPEVDFVYNKPNVPLSVEQAGDQTKIADLDNTESSSDAEIEKLILCIDASDELNQAELFGNQIYV